MEQKYGYAALPELFPNLERSYRKMKIPWKSILKWPQQKNPRQSSRNVDKASMEYWVTHLQRNGYSYNQIYEHNWINT